MQPDLLIFDCDGVLIDSEAIGCRVDAAFLGECGISISVEEVMDRYLGVSSSTMCADLAERYGSALPADFATALHHRAAAAFEAELAPMPGIEGMLDALPQRRCVASSSAPERLRHTLSLTGLLHRFEPHIFSATQVARGKPAPDLFLFASSSMQVEPAACLVIEDSMPGVQAAVAAGMRVIGFTGGAHCRTGHADRLAQAGAAAVVSEMSRLIEFISLV